MKSTCAEFVFKCISNHINDYHGKSGQKKKKTSKVSKKSLRNGAFSKTCFKKVEFASILDTKFNE